MCLEPETNSGIGFLRKVNKYLFLYILFIFYFILIVINGGRSAVESPEFRGTKMDVKVSMLNSVIDELSK